MPPRRAVLKGYDTCDVRSPGAPRPGIKNLQLVAAKIAGYTKVEKVGGLDAGVWAYRFWRGAPVTFVWHEDDVLQLPGEGGKAVAASIPVPGASSALVTWAVVDPAASAPASKTLPVTAGAVTVDLSGVPVVVEPAP